VTWATDFEFKFKVDFDMSVVDFDIQQDFLRATDYDFNFNVNF